jgi:hypothetical protein
MYIKSPMNSKVSPELQIQIRFQQSTFSVEYSTFPSLLLYEKTG